MSRKPLTPEQKEKKRVADRLYYQKNRERLLSQMKEYRDTHKEEIRAWRLKHRQEHKEEYLSKEARYREENRESISKYREEHREEYRERNRKHYQENPEYHHERRRRYYTEHVSEELSNGKRYRNTRKGRAIVLVCGYDKSDSNRGYDTSGNITYEWVIEHIFHASCVYCGDSDWRHLGADRIDNDRPHTPDNVVCSCGICNNERGDKYTVAEFVEYRKTNPRKTDLSDTMLCNYEVTDTGALKKKKVTAPSKAE